MRRALSAVLLVCPLAACADILGVHDYTYFGGDGSVTTDSAADGAIEAATEGGPSDGGNESAPEAGCTLCTGTGTAACALSCTETSPMFLAVDSQRLYWTNAPASFRSLVRPSGAPSTYATGTTPNAASASNAQYYFTDGTGLRAAALDGGVRTLMAVSGANSVAGSPPQSAFLIFFTSPTGIYKCTLPDCTSPLLQIDMRVAPQGLATVWDPNGGGNPYGYWAEVGNAQHPILGAHLVGGFNVVQHASIMTTTNVLAAEDTTHVWFTTYASGKTDLYRVGDGSPKYTVPGVVRSLAAGGGGVWLAVDDTAMASNGRVVKFDGTNASIVAQNQDRPSSVVLDAMYVYWTTLGGTLMRAGR